MAYNYAFIDLVISDIDETLSYIINKCYNKKAANDLIKDIENTIGNICVYPMSYPNCKYYYIMDETIRHAFIKNYILVFKVYDTKIVFIRFRYSKQNKIL